MARAGSQGDHRHVECSKMTSLSKVEKLRAGQMVAVDLRAPSRRLSRPVKVVPREAIDARTSDMPVLREVPAVEALRGGAALVGLEFEAQDEANPIAATCKVCGRVFYVGQAVSRQLGLEHGEIAKGKQGLPSFCADCVPKPQDVCAGWRGPCEFNNRPGRQAFQPAIVRRRHGGAWVCHACASQRTVIEANVNRAPEQRRESGRRGALFKSNCRRLTVDGRTQLMRDWAKEKGLNESTICWRLKRGWDVTRAVTTPSKKAAP